MDDEKEHTPSAGAKERAKPSTITEGVGNLVQSVSHLVKETASVVTGHLKSPAAVSKRIETAVPEIEENYDAPPMTADELAEHAAADNQPGEMVPAAIPIGIEVIGTPDPSPPHLFDAAPKKLRAKRKVRSKSGTNRLTNVLANPSAPKKAAAKKKAAKKGAKKATKKSKKTALRKGVRKPRPKKTVKKAKASAKKTGAKKIVRKKKRSEE